MNENSTVVENSGINTRTEWKNIMTISNYRLNIRIDEELVCVFLFRFLSVFIKSSSSNKSYTNCVFKSVEDAMC